MATLLGLAFFGAAWASFLYDRLTSLLPRSWSFDRRLAVARWLAIGWFAACFLAADYFVN